jgi:hypothetical protein
MGAISLGACGSSMFSNILFAAKRILPGKGSEFH